jgi:response regulator RpfG family c-di-GMP phosphodiesterase
VPDASYVAKSRGARYIQHVRLVLVDDDMAIRAVLFRELKRRFDVTVAADAAHALEALSNLPEVGVVVSDLDLGEGPDGLAVLEDAGRRHPQSVRLLISGSSRAPDLARAHPAVIHAWLPKPWPERSVTTTINTLLERRNLAKGSQPTRAAGRSLALEVDVRLASGALFRPTQTTDLDLGGLRMQLADEPALGQEVSVTLHLPSGERPTITGRVSRVDPAEARFDVAVEFGPLSPEQRAALTAALKR